MSASLILILCYLTTINQMIKVLTQDLCSQTRVDSIAYIDDTKQYFITAGGYYYVVKESDMTPRTGIKLRSGWTGDAAVYMNYLKNCQTGIYQERQVILLQKTTFGNQYWIYDLRTSSFYLVPASISSYHAISTIHIDWSKTVDAMFSYPTHEVYAIQGNRYAGANWKNICTNIFSFAVPFANSSNPKTDFETTRKIDAMTYKEGVGFYVFTSEEFYVLPIDKQASGNGKFRRLSKGNSKSINKYFFKCEKLLQTTAITVPTEKSVPPTTEPQQTPETDAPEQTSLEPPITAHPIPLSTERPVDVTEPENEETSAAAAAEKKASKKEGSNSIVWVIIGILLLIMVIVIIGVLVFLAIRRRRKQEKIYVNSEQSLKTEDSIKSEKSSSKIRSESKVASKSQIDKRGANSP